MHQQKKGGRAGPPKVIADKAQRSNISAARADQQSWCAVYAGQACIGHTIRRGRHGFEAFDVDDKSIGVFADVAAAANALERGRR